MSIFGSRLSSCASAMLAIGGFSVPLSVGAAVLCALDTSTRASLPQSLMINHRAKTPNAARLCMADANGSPWTLGSGVATSGVLNIAGNVRQDSYDDRDFTDPGRRITRFSGRTDVPTSHRTEDDFIGNHKAVGATHDKHFADRGKWHGRSYNSNEHVRDWEDRLRHSHKNGGYDLDWERGEEPVTAVPVPASAVLFASGLALLGFVRRRKTQRTESAR